MAMLNLIHCGRDGRLAVQSESSNHSVPACCLKKVAHERPALFINLAGCHSRGRVLSEGVFNVLLKLFPTNHSASRQLSQTARRTWTCSSGCPGDSLTKAGPSCLTAVCFCGGGDPHYQGLPSLSRTHVSFDRANSSWRSPATSSNFLVENMSRLQCDMCVC